MSSFFERRELNSQTAMVVAVMFTAGVLVAICFGAVPTWQNHGPDAGAGLVRRSADPWKYDVLTLAYACTATLSWFFTFFRFPKVTLTHIRLLFLGAFLALFIPLIYSLVTADKSQSKAQDAWERIQTLGGHGVWEPDMVVVSLANTNVADSDLALFADFPHVQILNLSNTSVTDAGLQHLKHLDSLTSLVLIETAVNPEAIEEFKSSHPAVDVQTEPTPSDAINPFTGEPFGKDGN